MRDIVILLSGLYWNHKMTWEMSLPSCSEKGFWYYCFLICLIEFISGDNRRNVLLVKTHSYNIITLKYFLISTIK